MKILKGHSDEICQADFSQDGNYIVTASEDDTIVLWTHDGNIVKTYGHKARASYKCALFSRDGPYIISSNVSNHIEFLPLPD